MRTKPAFVRVFVGSVRNKLISLPKPAACSKLVGLAYRLRRFKGVAVTEKKEQQMDQQRPLEESQQEARRQAYIEKVRESTREIADRLRRSEQLSAEDYAVQINATEF